ncbi:unnamed protein product [Rangifer tarandus platyrhynchus]|uniref:Uncharacterized protein n=1 Tax=Rangifer tarandus platyrhynchus TaxID=3082113 RepID=A0AC60A7C7_RANTA
MVTAVAAAGPTEGGTGGNGRSVSGVGYGGLPGSRLPSGGWRCRLGRQEGGQGRVPAAPSAGRLPRPHLPQSLPHPLALSHRHLLETVREAGPLCLVLDTRTSQVPANNHPTGPGAGEAS